MSTYSGKILKLDLTNRKTGIIPTSKYEKWFGGVGMGAAIFWDEVDKDYITDTSQITGFEPENVICILPGRLCGTNVPGNARIDICGLAPETYPRPQFMRSGLGGYFGPMLKFAGYDGIVVIGKSDVPVWVDIRNEDVQIKDAGDLWGKGFFDTQRDIWKEVHNASSPFPNQNWLEAATQQAAVLGIGPAGESQSRLACLVHGTNCAAGQGGFGGVFGSKNLKAISVIGTGSVNIASPKELMETYLWVKEHKPRKQAAMFAGQGMSMGGGDPRERRSMACFGCPATCRGVNTTEKVMSGAGQKCAASFFYTPEDMHAHGKLTTAHHVAGQLLHDYSINGIAVWVMIMWLEYLHERGLLGKGKQIDTNLDFDDVGSEEFVREFLRVIAYHEDIGADLCEGQVRAAAKWGLLEEGFETGIISAILWGLGEQHWTNNMGWAYSSLFDGRDINAHDLQFYSDLENIPARFAELAPPWYDELMFDQSEDGVYSIHMARRASWTERFYNVKSSLPWCDRLPFDSFNETTADGKGISPEMEERFYRAVTGEDITWAELLELGRKIWNFKRAILVLNGRHRDEEYFPPFPPYYNSYVYKEGPPTLQWGNILMRTELYGMRYRFSGKPVPVGEPFRNFDLQSMTNILAEAEVMSMHANIVYPVYKDGKWEWSRELFPLNKDRMDEFKTLYYELEGWDAGTGWPTRSALEDCGIGEVAGVLEKQGKPLKP